MVENLKTFILNCVSMQADAARMGLAKAEIALGKCAQDAMTKLQRTVQEAAEAKAKAKRTPRAKRGPRPVEAAPEKAQAAS